MKNNGGFTLLRFTNRKTPCGRYFVDGYSLSGLVDSRFLKDVIKAEIVTSNGLMVSLPNHFAIMLKDKIIYDKKYKKMGHYEQNYAEQRESQIIQLCHEAKDDPDLLVDHYLFNFPEKINNLLTDDKPSKLTNDKIVFYHIQDVKQLPNNKTLDLSTTYYHIEWVVTVGDKRRMLEIVTSNDTDIVADLLAAGMRLDSPNTPSS